MIVGIPFLVIGLGLIIVAYVLITRLYLNTKKELEKVILEAKLAEEKIRRDSVEQQRTTIRGQVSEEIIPLSENFPYNLRDCRFSGQPIDYIVYDGLSEFRDGVDKEISIIFSDVKTGNARLSRAQRGIRDAITAGRVRFETWKFDNNNKLNIK